MGTSELAMKELYSVKCGEADMTDLSRELKVP
jgi:hypothetical protein